MPLRLVAGLLQIVGVVFRINQGRLAHPALKYGLD